MENESFESSPQKPDSERLEAVERTVELESENVETVRLSITERIQNVLEQAKHMTLSLRSGRTFSAEKERHIQQIDQEMEEVANQGISAVQEISVGSNDDDLTEEKSELPTLSEQAAQSGEYTQRVQPARSFKQRVKKYFENAAIASLLLQSGLSPAVAEERFDAQLHGDQIVTVEKKETSGAKDIIRENMERERASLIEAYSQCAAYEVGISLSNEVLVDQYELELFLNSLNIEQQKGKFVISKAFEDELAERNLQTGDPIEYFDFDRLPSADILRRLPAELAQAVYDQKPQTIEIPRYLTNIAIAPDSSGQHAQVYVSWYDQSTDSMHIDTEPLTLDISQPIDQVQLAHDVAERLAIKQRSAALEEPAELGLDITAEKLADENGTLLIESLPREQFLVRARNEQFSPDEIALLDSLKAQDAEIECSFLMDKTQRFETVLLPIDYLKNRGKLDFQGLVDLSVAYPNGTKYAEKLPQWSQKELFEAYEASHLTNDPEINFDEPHVTVENQGQHIELGRIPVLENIKHRYQDGYHIYELKKTTADTSYAEYHDFEEVTQGVQSVEEDFGFDKGSLIKRIILTPDTWGAYSGFDTVAVKVGTKAHAKQYDHELVARHEGVHLVTDRFNVDFSDTQTQLDSSDMSRFFASVKDSSDFHGNLREGVFDRNNPRVLKAAGHPQDNLSEFYSSLYNTLYAQEHMSVLRESDTSFLTHYKEALTQYMIRLMEIDQIPEDAPVFEKLAKRIAEVEVVLSEQLESTVED